MRSHVVDVRSALTALGCAFFVAGSLQIVRSQGLLAISDDDYARVVIAQEFAANPRWDPSATSWLPLPFWVTGVALKAGAATLDYARSVTVAFNSVCCAVLWALGRSLGLGRDQSAFLTLAAALLPSALWLGAAAIPEFSSAILITISCMSLLTPCSSWWRVGGGCTMALACASRYEAWPVAVGVVAYNAWDLVEARKHSSVRPGRLMMACGLGLAFPLVWMLHGGLHHNDPLFFLERVSKYRAALGQDLPNWRQLLGGYPRALVAVEPLPLAGGLSALGLVITQRARGRIAPADRSPSPRAMRVASLLALQVAVLVFGEARGGAPTHHPERALLAVWTTTSFLAGFIWCTRSTVCTGRYLAGSAAIYVLLAHLMAPWGTRLAESRLRAPEEELGHKLASLYPAKTVGIVTNDYGYFAIMAAAGTPGRFEIWSRHDPRERRAPTALPAWIDERALSLLIVPHGSAVQNASLGEAQLVPRHRSEQFVLYSIER